MPEQRTAQRWDVVLRRLSTGDEFWYETHQVEAVVDIREGVLSLVTETNQLIAAFGPSRWLSVTPVPPDGELPSRAEQAIEAIIGMADVTKSKNHAETINRIWSLAVQASRTPGDPLR